MSTEINPAVRELGWRYWLKDHRAQVYLLWAVIVAGGYLHLHFSPDDNHIFTWAIASAVAFGYMLYTMPMKQAKMRAIFAAWFVPITVGFIITIAAFENDNLTGLIPYLGAVWAAVQALGFALNGLVDPPSGWYWFAAIANLLLAVALFVFSPLFGFQYLLLGIVTSWSMLNLWVFRSIYF